jgi:hypothetical protein
MNETSIDRLHELFVYHPLTGDLCRKAAARGRAAGSIVGGAHTAGYWQVNIKGRMFLAHRLAWAMTHGKWPEADIDHFNGDRSDNRLANLRAATRSENLQNHRRTRSDNTSGVTGVFWNTRHNKWQANIMLNGRNKYLGIFAEKEAAIAAYAAARKTMHPFAEVSI